MSLDYFLILEFLGLGFSLFLFHPRNYRSLRLLIVILYTTAAAEYLGRYWRLVLHRPSNHQVYNVSAPIIIVLFLVLLRSHLRGSTNRRTVGWALAAFLAFGAVNLRWIQKNTYFNSYTYIIAAVALTLAGVLYYYEFVKRKEVVSVADEPMFWITAAVLFLYVPKAVLYSLFEYVKYFDPPAIQAFGFTFRLLNQVLSLIFFSLLAYASVCRLISRK